MSDDIRSATARRRVLEVGRRFVPARHLLVRASCASLLLCLGGALLAQAGPNHGSHHLGFTRSIFSNRNKNDTLAALKSWAQTITRERGVEVEPDMRIFETTEKVRNAVQANSVDSVTLLLDEYSALPAGLLSGPCFRNEVHGTTHVEFVLLGRTDGGVTRLGDLRGAKLIAHDDPEVWLAVNWLEAELDASGLAPLEDLVAGFDRNAKLSATVLSVFFGKNDACLVTREGLETMVELNPQLSKQLSVVAVSPAVIPAIFCFRSNLDETMKARFFTEILALGETVTGQQVLRVFKADRMAEVTAEELDRSLALMNRWKASATRRCGPTAVGSK